MRKMKIFGREIPAVLIGALLVGGGLASAAILSYYAIITGTVTVSQAVLLDGKDYKQTQTFAWDGKEYPQGKTYIEAHTLQNNADVEITIDFKTTCQFSDGETGR